MLAVVCPFDVVFHRFDLLLEQQFEFGQFRAFAFGSLALIVHILKLSEALSYV